MLTKRERKVWGQALKIVRRNYLEDNVVWLTPAHAPRARADLASLHRRDRALRFHIYDPRRVGRGGGGTRVATAEGRAGRNTGTQQRQLRSWSTAESAKPWQVAQPVGRAGLVYSWGIS